MAKIEPAVTQLLYQVPDGASYIDLAKDLSKVNRRLYRQGMTYVVQDIQFGTSSGMRSSDIQALTFSTAGNSWIVHNAWKKGFAAFRLQRAQVKRALGTDIEGKWADFKVYLDDSMRAGTTLEPYAGDGAVYQAGDWEYSQFVWDDDGTERETYAHLIGADISTTDFALIQNYADSRARVRETPSVEEEASSTMYAKLSHLGDDELMQDLIENIEDANDKPPYDLDDYPGGAANADAVVPARFGSTTGSVATAMMPGFIVPCGLIQVYNSEMALNLTQHITDQAGDSNTDAPGPNSVYSVGSAATAYVIITVAPGPYRGVLAAPMGQ